MTSVIFPRVRCVLCRHNVFHSWFSQTSRQFVVTCDTYQCDNTGKTLITDIWWNLPVLQKSVRDKQMTVDMNIAVMDTHKHHCCKDVPTVLGIHGLPERSDDFDPLITELNDRGIRFVSPLFPGFERSSVERWKMKHIDFSTEGRAQILCSVLNQLDIHRVDVLLCYSSGSWLGYKISGEWNIIKAAGFLNPTGARTPRMLKPYVFMQVVAGMLLVEWIAGALMSILVAAYKVLGFVDVRPGIHLIANQQIVTHQGLEKMPGYAAKIAKRKLPMFIACCKNDNVTEIDITREMALQHLNIPQENVIEYDLQERPNKDPLKELKDWKAKLLIFERGGHKVHKAHSVDVLEHILDLIKHVQKHEPP